MGGALAGLFGRSGGAGQFGGPKVVGQSGGSLGAGQVGRSIFSGFIKRKQQGFNSRKAKKRKESKCALSFCRPVISHHVDIVYKLSYHCLILHIYSRFSRTA